MQPAPALREPCTRLDRRLRPRGARCDRAACPASARACTGAWRRHQEVVMDYAETRPWAKKVKRSGPCDNCGCQVSTQWCAAAAARGIGPGGALCAKINAR